MFKIIIVEDDITVRRELEILMKNALPVHWTQKQEGFFLLRTIWLLCRMTVLSVQQMSDGAKYKFRYDILRKLGMKLSHLFCGHLRWI